MSLVPNPVEDALQALQSAGLVPTDEGANGEYSSGPQQWLPYLEHQSYDPTLPSYQAPPGLAPPAAPPPGTFQASITHQQAYPNDAQEAQIQRAQLLRDTERPLPPGDVEGAQARENTAYGEYEQAARKNAQAQQDAATVQQAKVAEVHERYAKDLGTANQEYQKARQAAEAEADQKTEAFLAEYQQKAKQEPNPDRWFESRSSFGKALWIIGLLSGGVHAALTPGARNAALDLFNKEMSDDIARQKERLERELEGLKMKGKTVSERSARLMTDLKSDHEMALGRLEVLHNAWMEKAKIPGVAADIAAQAQVDQLLSEKKLALATDYRKQAYDQREAQLSRAHTMTIAKMTDSRERDIAAANNARMYDLARMEQEGKVEEARIKAAGEVHKDDVRIGPETGLTVYDEDGKPMGGDGALWVNKAFEPKAVQAKITAANQERSDMDYLYSALKDESSWSEIMTGTNTEAKQALARLKKSHAGREGGLGKMTDKDMELLDEAFMGVGTGSVIDRSKLLATRGKVLEVLQRNIRNQKLEVENSLKGMHSNPEGKKIRIDWRPQGVTAPKVEAPTPGEQIAQLGGKPIPQPTPKNVEELRVARKSGFSQNAIGTQAAGEHASLLQDLDNDLVGATPDHIAAAASAALDAVTPDEWGGKHDSPGAQFARNAYIPDAVQTALAKAKKAEKGLVDYLKDEQTKPKSFIKGYEPPKLTREHVMDIAMTEFELVNGVQLDTPEGAEYLDRIIRQVERSVKGK